MQLGGRPCGRLHLLLGYVQEGFRKALNNFILQKYLPRAGRTGTHDRARACALGGHTWWVPAVGRPGMGAEATQGARWQRARTTAVIMALERRDASSHPW